jgi:hypothetical protein
MPKRILGWTAVAYLVFYVARYPGDAALTVKNLGSGLTSVADRFSEFVVAVAAHTP